MRRRRWPRQNGGAGHETPLLPPPFPAGRPAPPSVGRAPCPARRFARSAAAWLPLLVAVAGCSSSSSSTSNPDGGTTGAIVSDPSCPAPSAANCGAKASVCGPVVQMLTVACTGGFPLMLQLSMA